MSYAPRNNLGVFLVTATIVIVAALIMVSACQPLSTRPFDPTQKQSVAEQVAKDRNRGRGLHSGMDCLELIQAQLEWCRKYGTCSYQQALHLQRAERRLSKVYSSKCVYSDYHLSEVMRTLRRQQSRPNSK